MSQMQAFWRLTDSTLYTIYADSRGEPTICPHFPGFSLPKPAREKRARLLRTTRTAIEQTSPVTASKSREAMNWFHQRVCRLVRWRGRLKGLLPCALHGVDL